MDLNQAYAAHQRAVIDADRAANDDQRSTGFAAAAVIGERISSFQHGLGAAAACAWSNALFTGVHTPRGTNGALSASGITIGPQPERPA